MKNTEMFLSMCFIFILLFFGGSIMTKAQEPEHKKAFKSTQKTNLDLNSVTLDLNSEDKAMGSEIGPILAKEGTITLGKFYTEYLEPEKIQQFTANNSDFYLINFYFTLNELMGGKSYEEARIYFALSDNNTVAYDLLPKETFDKENSAMEYGIDTSLKFKVFDAKIHFLKKIHIEKLNPTITAYNIGRNEFHWAFTSTKGKKIFPGSSKLYMIIDTPHNSTAIDVKVWVEAVVIKDLFGITITKETKTDDYIFSLNLNKIRP
ncbi:MAG: hypothetical protein L3V56_06065 [Candidatus Magnetoovum sp. WYHC-5]|nr:hypothetical protein [Candidatus Magnetoovum sp. WYHC-5]